MHHMLLSILAQITHIFALTVVNEHTVRVKLLDGALAATVILGLTADPELVTVTTFDLATLQLQVVTTDSALKIATMSSAILDAYVLANATFTYNLPYPQFIREVVANVSTSGFFLVEYVDTDTLRFTPS